VSKKGVILKYGLVVVVVIQKHRKWHGRSHTTSYRRSIVTTAQSCIISEIKRNTGRDFIIPHLHSTRYLATKITTGNVIQRNVRICFPKD